MGLSDRARCCCASITPAYVADQTVSQPAVAAEPPFKAGDVVELKSGGSDMVVVQVNPNSCVCAWMNSGDELQLAEIWNVALSHVEPAFNSPFFRAAAVSAIDYATKNDEVLNLFKSFGSWPSEDK